MPMIGAWEEHGKWPGGSECRNSNVNEAWCVVGMNTEPLQSHKLRVLSGSVIVNSVCGNGFWACPRALFPTFVTVLLTVRIE